MKKENPIEVEKSFNSIYISNIMICLGIHEQFFIYMYSCRILDLWNIAYIEFYCTNKSMIVIYIIFRELLESIYCTYDNNVLKYTLKILRKPILNALKICHRIASLFRSQINFSIIPMFSPIRTPLLLLQTNSLDRSTRMLKQSLRQVIYNALSHLSASLIRHTYNIAKI